MREIKFRVYDKSDHEWFKNGHRRMFYFGSEYWISDDGHMQFKSPPGLSPIGDHDQKRFSPLMQYTGLKDKNGVDIYVGDILDDKTVVDSQMQWNCGCCNKVYGWGFNYSEADALVVIGNIFENPELLEGNGKT
jgi:hypothetical protein